MTIAASRLKEVTSTEYTPEQLDTLPQTEKVFDRPAMEFNAHEWRQEGYMITDNCNPQRPDCHNVGIPIPSGKVLIKTKGGYEFRNEL